MRREASGGVLCGIVWLFVGVFCFFVGLYSFLLLFQQVHEILILKLSSDEVGPGRQLIAN